MVGSIGTGRLFSCGAAIEIILGARGWDNNFEGLL